MHCGMSRTTEKLEAENEWLINNRDEQFVRFAARLYFSWLKNGKWSVYSFQLWSSNLMDSYGWRLNWFKCLGTSRLFLVQHRFLFIRILGCFYHDCLFKTASSFTFLSCFVGGKKCCFSFGNSRSLPSQRGHVSALWWTDALCWFISLKLPECRAADQKQKGESAAL